MPNGVKLGHDGPHLFMPLMNGVGGTPMPSFSDSLKPDEAWDVVHFLQSLRVNAHIQELLEAGMAPSDEQKARKQLWEDISAAAAQGKLDTALLQTAPASGNTRVAMRQPSSARGQ